MSTFTDVLQGVPATLGITAGALAIGIVGGIPLVLARVGRFVALRVVCRPLIDLVRGIPPIVWLFILYFGIGTYAPSLTAMTAAVLGLGLISAAYFAEIYRGGLNAIKAGQWEAASALALSRSTTLWSVIMPQVARVCLPAAVTYGVSLLKDSSIAYVIGVTEILYYANDISTRESNPVGPYLWATLIYLAITIPCTMAARYLGARVAGRVAR
ncbi:amino acid ABC transporter permease [Amycolatopsis jejuensis]|uniref:amino acid ABC transporter permease n=1 Tax=Amycolatopsis jejuensis TaxID=330084 RepID=UPI000525B830|nr:amino acid ABC transporter permease [Amycolatopsis jejuensis]